MRRLSPPICPVHKFPKEEDSPNIWKCPKCEDEIRQMKIKMGVFPSRQRVISDREQGDRDWWAGKI